MNIVLKQIPGLLTWMFSSAIAASYSAIDSMGRSAIRLEYQLL